MDFGVSVNWDFAVSWVSPPLSGSRSPILRYAVRSFRVDAFVSPIFIFCSSRSPIFSRLSPPWSSFGVFFAQIVRFHCVILLFLHFPARLVNYFSGSCRFGFAPPLRSIGVPMLTRRFWPKCMIPLHIYALFTLAVTFGIDFCDAFLVAIWLKHVVLILSIFRPRRHTFARIE